MKDVIIDYLANHASGWDSNQAEMDAKAERNQRIGEEQLLNGTVVPFKGYSKTDLERQINVILLFDQRSQDRINEIAGSLEKIAGDYQLPSISTCNGDLPPHITLQPGILTGMSATEIAAELTRIGEDPLMREVIEELGGTGFYLEDLVSSGRDTYLSCTTPPPSVNWARDQVSEVYLNGKETVTVPYRDNAQSEIGIKPVNYGDIVHVTINRRIGPPLAVPAEYINDMRKLREVINNTPIPVTVGRVFLGTSYDFVNAEAPHLIRREI